MQPTGLPPNFTPQMPMKMRPQEMPPNQSDPKTQQAMQMMGRMASQMREQMEAESLVKPNFQSINLDTLLWTWKLPDDAVIEATLYKNTKIYQIQLIQVGGNDVLTSETANIIGNALTSAGRWENLWKQYAGEYLLDDDNDDDAKGIK